MPASRKPMEVMPEVDIKVTPGRCQKLGNVSKVHAGIMETYESCGCRAPCHWLADANSMGPPMKAGFQSKTRCSAAGFRSGIEQFSDSALGLMLEWPLVPKWSERDATGAKHSTSTCAKSDAGAAPKARKRVQSSCRNHENL